MSQGTSQDCQEAGTSWSHWPYWSDRPYWRAGAGRGGGASGGYRVIWPSWSDRPLWTARSYWPDW